MKFQISMVVTSAILFLVVAFVNEWLFNRVHFAVVPGISWVYLPAGMRLLCTLLFGGAGAIGVMIASWIACLFFYFPGDLLRSLGGGITSAAAPFLVYKMAQQLYGLKPSLTNLDAKRLLLLAVAYSIASPTLYHLWLLVYGESITSAYFVMMIGDLLGTLFVIYTIKLLLQFLPVPVRRQ